MQNNRWYDGSFPSCLFDLLEKAVWCHAAKYCSWQLVPTLYMPWNLCDRESIEQHYQLFGLQALMAHTVYCSLTFSNPFPFFKRSMFAIRVVVGDVVQNGQPSWNNFIAIPFENYKSHYWESATVTVIPTKQTFPVPSKTACIRWWVRDWEWLGWLGQIKLTDAPSVLVKMGEAAQ